MAFTIEHLYKARDFVELKNISTSQIELTFKNPIMAMLAKGKVAEIAQQCNPDSPFTSCVQNGNDLVMTFNPEVMNQMLLGKVFSGSDDEAKEAVKQLSEHIAKAMA